jgi:hypothetical protein
MTEHDEAKGGTRDPDDVPGSLTLSGAVALGTGVMIGAGIFAITGQTAQLAGDMFPLAFLAAAVVVSLSAYSYVKLSNAFPSSGGVAMFLHEQYGPGTATGVFAIFMYVSMVINESLVARTFGTYVLQLIDLEPATFWIPTLAVGLLAVAFAVNIAGNAAMQRTQRAMAAIKIVGLGTFAVAGLWFAESANFTNGSATQVDPSIGGFLAAVALAILAYKGFTTITNSGGEIKDPHRNTGRAIIIALVLCAVVYLAIAATVAGNLTVSEILKAEDFSLAEAARPAFGQAGVWFTVVLAVVATASSWRVSSLRANARDADANDPSTAPPFWNARIRPHPYDGVHGRLRHGARCHIGPSADRRAWSHLLPHHGHRHPLGPPTSPAGQGGVQRRNRRGGNRTRPRPARRVRVGQGVHRHSWPHRRGRRHCRNRPGGAMVHALPHQTGRHHGHVNGHVGWPVLGFVDVAQVPELQRFCTAMTAQRAAAHRTRSVPTPVGAQCSPQM